MIERRDVEKLATLARINVPAEEIDSIRDEISAILEYVSQIEEAGGASVNPSADFARNIMRDDITPHEPGVFTEQLLSQAPEREGQYIKVKKIL